jgi:uncharacterized small protein (DUF1192 family)
MDESEVQALTSQPKLRPLDTLSIDELRDYVTDMEAEIQRVRGVITARERHRQSAESFFKK